MDAVDDHGYVVNPSSLHAVLHRITRPGDSGGGGGGGDGGDVPSALTQGVDGQAVRLDGVHSFIDVDTSALKMECFGDLNKCHMGEYSSV